MLKSLLSYMYDCTKEEIKNASFKNLLADKKNIIFYTNDNEFYIDNKDIINLIKTYEINKNEKSLIIGKYFLKNEKIYSPLIYKDIEFIIDNDKVIINSNSDYILNVGLVAGLLKYNDELDFIIEKLLNTVNSDLFLNVFKNLVDLSKFEIEEQRAIILTKLPDASAGLLKELNKILENVIIS